MKGFIYKVTNSINGKIYIGQTSKSVVSRWEQHLRDCYRAAFERRPLYQAINKYGRNAFTIETIEECEMDIINEREQYWIEFYDSMNNGYNATIGGDGRAWIDYDRVLKLYEEHHNAAEVARIMGCHVDSVRNYLNSQNIQLATMQEINKTKYRRVIQQLDKNTNEVLHEFESYADAGNYLIQNNLTRCKPSTIRYHISEVCHGKRLSAAGYKWKDLSLDNMDL